MAPRHSRWVPKAQKSSLSGSFTASSDSTAASPYRLGPPAPLLGPPSVPRSTRGPAPYQRKECCGPLGTRFDCPAIQPRLFMSFDVALFPFPNAPRSVTVYCGCLQAGAWARAAADISDATRPRDKEVNFVCMFISSPWLFSARERAANSGRSELSHWQPVIDAVHLNLAIPLIQVVPGSRSRRWLRERA